MHLPAAKARCAALLVVLASCSDRRPEPMVIEHDSAGVSIALLAPVKAWPARGVLADDPLLTFGGAASADSPQLSNEYWIPVATLSDRSIVVGDHTRFFLFRDDGTLINVIGRQGDGPGEFRDLRTICAGRGDTLLLVDDGRRMATIYDVPERVVARQFPTISEVHPDACSTLLSVLVSGLPVPDAPEGHPAARYELRNSVGDTVAEYPNLPKAHYGKYEVEPSFQFRTDSLFVADGQRMEIRVYAPGGDLSRIVRVHERTDGRESGVEPVKAVPAYGTHASVVEPSGGVRPNYKTFKLGSDGRYWFLTQVDGVTEGGWVAVSADGHPIGTVTMPRRSGEFRVLKFFGDTVLVAEERADGQRQLAKYLIIWSDLPSSSGA